MVPGARLREREERTSSPTSKTSTRRKRVLVATKSDRDRGWGGDERKSEKVLGGSRGKCGREGEGERERRNKREREQVGGVGGQKRGVERDGEVVCARARACMCQEEPTSDKGSGEDPGRSGKLRGTTNDGKIGKTGKGSLSRVAKAPIRGFTGGTRGHRTRRRVCPPERDRRAQRDQFSL